MHLVDIILQLSPGAPQETFAGFHHIQNQGGAEDAFSMMIRFDDGSTAQTEVLKAACGKAMLHICGTKGTIHIVNSAVPGIVDVKVYSAKELQQSETIDFRTEAGDKLGRPHKDFARRLLNGEPPARKRSAPNEGGGCRAQKR